MAGPSGSKFGLCDGQWGLNRDFVKFWLGLFGVNKGFVRANGC